jgi:TRAP-type C4-dicarboxylate transport system permease small subunit
MPNSIMGNPANNAIRAAALTNPVGEAALAASKGAQLASFVFAACAFIMFAIFVGTMAGWIQQKNKGDKADNTKKKNLFNSWIAFLVLFFCCLMLFFGAHHASQAADPAHVVHSIIGA